MITTATIQSASRLFRHPETGDTVTLTYSYRPRAVRPHVVEEHAGDYPEVNRYETVEAARERWGTLEGRLRAAGFEVGETTVG